jgi:hypothetical protein
MEKRKSLKYDELIDVVKSPTQRIRVAVLAECTQIDRSSLASLVKQMKDIAESNEALLELLDTEKNQYLFYSCDLRKLIFTTESVRTKLAIIDMIAPRLSDPAEDRAFFVDCFRFCEEKEKVVDLLCSTVLPSFTTVPRSVTSA